MNSQTTNEIEQLYAQRAANYDISEKIYRLFGFREEHYRREAIAGLKLQSGDTVIDLGCGTGKNFTQIIERIGRNGTLIGIDLTAAMLAQAQQKIKRNGWTNVQLINADVGAYIFPEHVDAILSTFALSFSADFAQVIQRSAHALTASGRLAIADMQWTDELPTWLMRVGTRFAGLFGVSHTSLKRDLTGVIEQTFSKSLIKPHYFSTVFVGIGICQ